MKLVLTGGRGFLGWHVRCRARMLGLPDPIVIDRLTAANRRLFVAAVADADAVIHAAGVNRANTEDEIRSGNRQAAEELAAVLGHADSMAAVVYANSRKVDAGGAYGEAKAEAGALLADRCRSLGVAFHDVVLPHLFGEFGRPFYNSAIHTFAHQLVVGDPCQVDTDAELELLHAQDAAQLLLDLAIDGDRSSEVRPEGRVVRVSQALERLSELVGPYLERGSIPDLADRLDLQLFNTLRANYYPDRYPQQLTVHGDDRGDFYEVLRGFGQGQTSLSTTKPGITRGDHFHVDKVERFVVVRGQARLNLRRLFSSEVVSYDVSGDRPVFIDMPPLTTHNIVNTGADELVTLFWSHDHFDPERPDTYPEPVQPVLAGAVSR